MASSLNENSRSLNDSLGAAVGEVRLDMAQLQQRDGVSDRTQSLTVHISPSALIPSPPPAQRFSLNAVRSKVYIYIYFISIYAKLPGLTATPGVSTLTPFPNFLKLLPPW